MSNYYWMCECGWEARDHSGETSPENCPVCRGVVDLVSGDDALSRALAEEKPTQDNDTCDYCPEAGYCRGAVPCPRGYK